MVHPSACMSGGGGGKGHNDYQYQSLGFLIRDILLNQPKSRILILKALQYG